MKQGYVLYSGPSLLNSQPITAICTGFLRSSTNPKTGPMLQTWIIPSDTHPYSAVLNNQDVSVCGECPFKGDGGKGRICYVNIASVGRVYSYHQREGYSLLPNYSLFLGRRVRFGSYGDPVAIPIDIWLNVLEYSYKHTGYTNQWRSNRLDPRYKSFLMASCASEEEQQQAQSWGWRTYRVKLPDQPLLSKEKVCPASAEAGRITNCYSCCICNAGSQNIVVDVHGSGRKSIFQKSTPQVQASTCQN